MRDNIHALDVCRAALAFAEQPSSGAVYNLGGGRENSISLLEASARLEELTGQKLQTEYVDEPRRGDHVCYITNLARFRHDYPGWEPAVGLEEILAELAQPAGTD